MADIITYPENGITYDADDASGYLATRLSGVYSSEEDFAVTAQGGLSVQVSAGQAWVRPARFKGRSIIMEQPTTVVLTEADPVRSRIDRILREHDMDPEGKYIGFVLRKWPGIEEKATVFAAGAVYAYLKHGLTPVFLSINFRTDGEASRLVTEHLSIPYYMIDEQMSTGEVIGVLSRMTTVVSMRLHGLIFAAGQGVPLIGVAYDPKVTAFLDYVEQNNYMQFEALNEKDLSDLIDSAVALAGRGEELRRRTELLNRQEDNNRATAARLLGKE